MPSSDSRPRRKNRKAVATQVTPPPGEVIADRFCSNALIASFWIANITTRWQSPLAEFVVLPQGGRRGMSDSGGYGGSFLNVYSSPEGTVFCGGEKRRVKGGEAIEAEKAMYEAIKQLPRALRSIIKKRHPKSLGITFGAHWDPSTRRWQDLTGSDPDLANMTSFPEAKDLYAEPTMRLAQRVARKLNEATHMPIPPEFFLSILRHEPLTRELVRKFILPCNAHYPATEIPWPVACQLAAVCGYPIAPGQG